MSGWEDDPQDAVVGRQDKGGWQRRFSILSIPLFLEKIKSHVYIHGGICQNIVNTQIYS